ncbi:MAG: AAA family ATPase [Elusimicrobia bacterium]|nr:AAA family ATPase [Elusimicrobiota bacterium]
MGPLKQEIELEVLIRARFPLIYLVSWEEQRALAMIEGISQRQRKKLLSWSITEGFGQDLGQSAAKDPQAALCQIGELREPALIVLKDFHACMQDPGIIRRLRDLVASFKSSFKTLIILSPTLTVPVELEKDLMVIDYDLPGQEELKSLLERVIAASQAGNKFAVDLSGAQKDRLIQSLQGLTLSEAENALAHAVVKNDKLDISAVDVVLEDIKQIIRKSKLLEYFEAKEEFAQVGGLEPLKNWIEKRGKAFSAQARDFGLPQPKGLLLLGVQGCGKSLVCKTVASLWKFPLLRLDMGAIFGGFVGQSEENMRRAIKTAEAVAPCVLWLDEIEKGLSGTQSSHVSDAGTTARVFSTFLTWLQEKTKPVFIAATANNISLLPPELLRKGRLDDIFFVDLPNEQERKEIFSIHIARRRRDPGRFDLERLAQSSGGYSGAEIEQAVIEALSEAFSQGKELSQDHIIKALAAQIPLSRTMSEEIDKLRQWASTRARPASATSPMAAQNGASRG